MKQYKVRLTDKISDKLSVYEAYFYYILALCTDFNTMESNAKQSTLAKMYYDIPNDKDPDKISNSYSDNIREYINTLHENKFIEIEKNTINGKYGSF